MQTKYIIKGLWDNQQVYYVGIDNKQTLFGLPIVRLSTTIDEAKLFDTTDEVEEAYEEVSHVSFKIYTVCPRCHKEYEDHPAVSRTDNKSYICSKCGVEEAMLDFIKYKQKNKATI